MRTRLQSSFPPEEEVSRIRSLKIPFQPSILLEWLFVRGTTPRRVNTGSCYIWAYAAWRLFPNVELWSTIGDGVHAFIRHKSLFFDAELLEGSRSYRHLIELREHQGEVKMLTLNKFLQEWPELGPRQGRADERCDALLLDRHDNEAPLP